MATQGTKDISGQVVSAEDSDTEGLRDKYDKEKLDIPAIRIRANILYIL